MDYQSDQVDVSIICITYNHGPYIRDALNGFISQKTDFCYEILIHDDASTDDTAEIIREYQMNYPALIKPIFEKENQYSKGITITNTIMFPLVKGKYIALCEGDDYWTDPLKLQKQYDELEKNNSVDMCAHTVSEERNGIITGEICPSESRRILTAEEVINGGGRFLGTNSLFFRTYMLSTIPEFIKILFFDYTLQIWGSLRGGILFLPDCMSVYRVQLPGSATRTMNSNPEQYFKREYRVIKMFGALEKDANQRIKPSVRYLREKHIFNLLMYEKKYSDIKRGECKEYYRSLPLIERVKITIKQIMHYFHIKY